MSGLVAVWRRDGAPTAAREAARRAALLAHRGVDGAGAWAEEAGDVAIVHLRFWTTPEEVGERQPLVTERSAVAFDGRLDNRAELGGALGLTAAEARAASDARLLQAAFERWGEACAARLAGPFAWVAWDRLARRLVCARDPLGRRSLGVLDAPAVLVAASEPGAATAGDPRRAPLDPVFLAHRYALRPAPEGRTIYEGVRELAPGHALAATASASSRHAFWRPPDAPLRLPRDEDYADRLAELLDRAVERRLRAWGAPAVLMSGGLDSPTVAALAARRLAALDPPRRLAAISYVFEARRELDERPWIAPMALRYGLEAAFVRGDDALTLRDLASWPWDPGGPSADMFGPLNGLLYAAARARGHRVLLTGAAADAVLGHGDASWLGDLVAGGRVAEAARELWRHLRALGPRRVAASRSVRRAAARLLGHRARPEPPPAWLLPAAAASVLARRGAPGIDGRWRQGIDARILLDDLDASRGEGAARAPHRAGVELRDPFADLDVVAFALSVPAYVLYNRGASKDVLRRVASELLPAESLARELRSDIGPLFHDGLAAAGAEIRRILDRPEACWRRFLRGDALGDLAEGRIAEPGPSVLLWTSFCIERWMLGRRDRSLDASGEP